MARAKVKNPKKLIRASNMKPPKNFQMQCNVLIFKTASKQVWLYFIQTHNYAVRIRRHYHESLDCFEYPPKHLLNQATPKKYTCQIFLPKHILESKISDPKFLQSSPSLEIHGSPWENYRRTVLDEPEKNIIHQEMK